MEVRGAGPGGGRGPGLSRSATLGGGRGGAAAAGGSSRDGVNWSKTMSGEAYRERGFDASTRLATECGHGREGGGGAGCGEAGRSVEGTSAVSAQAAGSTAGIGTGTASVLPCDCAAVCDVNYLTFVGARERAHVHVCSVAARKIPEYDASRDRHCPFTQSTKFKTQVARQAELDRRRQLARERGATIMAGGVHGNDPGRSRESVSPVTAPRAGSAGAGATAGAHGLTATGGA